MEADSSVPGERVKKQVRQQNDRGIKRPLLEMIGSSTNNDANKERDSQRVMRMCYAARGGADSGTQTCVIRPAKRIVPKKRCILATPSVPRDRQKRCKEEASSVCQQDHRKRTMRPVQVAPSGGGVPKLIRNQLKSGTDDKKDMHKQLQIEHLQLQRSFALWRQLVEEARSHKDNEELASWAEEKEGIIKSTKKLQDKVEELQEKLSEYREQNELLEFRILELDHCQNKQCPPCDDSLSPCGPVFCSTGCSQPEDPCFTLFQDQVAHYQDLEFRADELLEELRLLSAVPGLSCSQRSAVARSSLCVSRCKNEVMSAIGLLQPQQHQVMCSQDQDQLEPTTQNQAQFLGSQWLEKILFGRGSHGSVGGKTMDDDEAELSDQSLLQETSMTESEIGQALNAEWPDQKTSEHQQSEDEGLGEDSRRSTEPNSLVSEDFDTKTLLSLVDDLRKKNTSLRMELRQAELLVRTFKLQADKVQELEQELSRTERERSEYQEQILELEEAENDARLESQTLRALVENLRQHEDDLEKSLCATRDRLEECEHRACSAGTTAEELRSQVTYLEQLVYKYEEHIQGLERTESELHKKLQETKKTYADVEIQVNVLRKNFSDVSVQVEVNDVQCKCFQTTDALSRLQQLEDEGGGFKNQLHQVPDINLKLLQKPCCSCESDTCVCKRSEPIEQNKNATERLENLLSGGISSSNNITFLQQEVRDSDNAICERLTLLEGNERKLREQLFELERINHDFEKELEIRERLNRDKETELSQWVERERELKKAISDLETERVSLREQTAQLEEERLRLRDSLEQLQEEYGRLKLTHCQETRDLQVRHEETARNIQETKDQDEEDPQEIPKLTYETSHLRSEQVEMQPANELSLVFETEIRALRACHELEEIRLHDEMVSLRCKDDQCCSRVQDLVAQRERLELVLSEKEKQLENLTIEYQRKTDTMEEERKVVESELQKKMREMEENTAYAVQELEERRKQLETSLRADMEDLRSKESNYKTRIHELERNVDSLRNQITNIAQGVGTEEYPLEDSEYRYRIEELENKEAAYVETLENADKIISQMELRYRDNIQRLEGSERSLQERVVQLEATEAQLRSALQNEKRSSDNGRVADFVRELMEAEIRETSLKDHIDELEASHKALLQKVRELEKTNQQITEELHDHEEVSMTAGDLRHEQDRLKDEISQLKRSEAALKETLAHADSILAQREQVLAVRVSELQAEKQGSDEMVRQLREHVRTLQEQLDQAQFHQAGPGPRETADTEVSREEISDLKLECLSATQAHLGDLDTVRRNQERVIEQLEERKDDLEQRFKQLRRAVKVRENDFHTSKELQKRVLELEKLIRRSSWTSAETKETQTERSFYSNSRSVTAPVSPASSLDNLSNYQTEKEEEEVMMRREVLEDPSCLGMEERIELEHCMKRAMAAMERDLQIKNDQQMSHRHSLVNQVFHHEEDDEEEEELIRMPLSPACSSTSGCESDCSSSGGSCRWSGPVDHPSPSGSDLYEMDGENRQRERVEKHTVISRELPTLMKTKVIYPSIIKTEVKEMPTLITRHSEYQDEDSILESEHSLPESPRDFCILRHVGSDSLLLGWTPPKSNVNSYQILVNGDVQQHVRSPDRTKALLHKLDLTRPLIIAICSLAFQPQSGLEFISQPAVLRYDPVECHK